jgi:hypothetical protein
MTVQKADLEAKLQEIKEAVDETTDSARTAGIAIAVGVILLLLIVFLLGRRKGKQGSARVEVFRLG